MSNTALGARTPRRMTNRCGRWRGLRMAMRGRRLNLLQLTVASALQPAGRPRIDRALLEKTLHQQDAALRQERRRALQPDVGAAQVDAQQRRRRVDLLAGAHARGRRGSEVRGEAADSVRVGGHRQRRSAGAGDQRGREGRGALHRHARRQHRPCAGGAVSRHRAKEQRGLHGLQRRRRGREERRRRAGAAAHPQRADQVDEAAGLRQGLQVRARRAGRRVEHGLPAGQLERPRVLQAHGLRVRERNYKTTGVVEKTASSSRKSAAGFRLR